jgi:hypothetical protein
MRKAGTTYERIARELGYRGPSSAYKAIQSALQKTLQEPAHELRIIEMERLNALYFSVYQQARQGQLGAVDRCLKIHERIAKLMGLDRPSQLKLEMSNWQDAAKGLGMEEDEIADMFEEMVQHYYEKIKAQSGTVGSTS